MRVLKMFSDKETLLLNFDSLTTHDEIL